MNRESVTILEYNVLLKENEFLKEKISHLEEELKTFNEMYESMKKDIIIENGTIKTPIIPTSLPYFDEIRKPIEPTYPQIDQYKITCKVNNESA